MFVCMFVCMYAPYTIAHACTDSPQTRHARAWTQGDQHCGGQAVPGDPRGAWGADLWGTNRQLPCSSSVPYVKQGQSTAQSAPSLHDRQRRILKALPWQREACEGEKTLLGPSQELGLTTFPGLLGRQAGKAEAEWELG